MFVKSKILLLGSGGVGTIVALNLEAGGLASVTAVLRSNYDRVKQNGFDIRSCDHGELKGWRPSKSKYLATVLHRPDVLPITTQSSTTSQPATSKNSTT